jgi:UDP-2,3-diacylglucosamine pyrophosphatase LpxH
MKPACSLSCLLALGRLQSFSVIAGNIGSITLLYCSLFPLPFKRISGAPMFDIFLSDIHIGINAQTNLYQKSEHEAGLKAILKYVQENGEQIRNVVILGDWLDLWMYKTTAHPDSAFSIDSPPDNILPTVRQIIEVNPNVFTEQLDGSGDFISCIRKISGGFYYTNGNHDLTISNDEINSFLPADLREQRSINCSDRTYTIDQLYGEHGHHFSMVCRPCDNSPYPFGYYMTRAAADAGVKAPEDVLHQLVEFTVQGDSFAKAMLKVVAEQKNDEDFKYTDFRFVMPDSTTLTAEDVIAMFPDNESDFNLKEFIKTDLIMGVDNLGLSASDLHSQDPARKIILMGHTHVEQLNQKPALDWIYANTGFLCGDGDKTPSSFLAVDIDAAGSDSSAIDEYQITYDSAGKPVVEKRLRT